MRTINYATEKLPAKIGNLFFQPTALLLHILMNNSLSHKAEQSEKKKRKKVLKQTPMSSIESSISINYLLSKKIEVGNIIASFCREL